MTNLKMYIAVLDIFPDHMCPTLVAHAVLGAHQQVAQGYVNWSPYYSDWLVNSFKKVVLRVNQKEFDKICALENVYTCCENNTLEGKTSCVVVCPREDVPNVLKFAKMWKPKEIV